MASTLCDRCCLGVFPASDGGIIERNPRTYGCVWCARVCLEVRALQIAAYPKRNGSNNWEDPLDSAYYDSCMICVSLCVCLNVSLSWTHSSLIQYLPMCVILMRALGWTSTPSLNHFPVTFSSDTSHLNTACSADFTVRSAMLCSTCSSLSEAKTPTWINTNKCLFTTDNSTCFGQGQVVMWRLTMGWKCMILPEETQ